MPYTHNLLQEQKNRLAIEEAHLRQARIDAMARCRHTKEVLKQFLDGNKTLLNELRALLPNLNQDELNNSFYFTRALLDPSYEDESHEKKLAIANLCSIVNGANKRTIEEHDFHKVDGLLSAYFGLAIGVGFFMPLTLTAIVCATATIVLLGLMLGYYAENLEQSRSERIQEKNNTVMESLSFFAALKASNQHSQPERTEQAPPLQEAVFVATAPPLMG